MINHDLNKNYYAFVQPGENAWRSGQSAKRRRVSGNLPGDERYRRNTARYVIERMCLPAANGLEAEGRWCE